MTNTVTFHKRSIKPHHYHNYSTLHHRPFSNPKLFVIVSMASLLFLSFLAFHLLSLPASSIGSHSARRISPPSTVSVPPEIQQACKATRFPDLCQSSLSQSPGGGRGADPLKIVLAAIGVSGDNLQIGRKMVQEILDSSAGNANRSNAAKNCLEVLGNSAYRTQSTVDAVPSGKIKDARAWFSAALLYQYDCWSALKYANDTAKVNETMAFLNTLTMHSSNALSMLLSYDLFGKDTASWRPPQTERDGFWEQGSDDVSAFRGVLPSTLTPDVNVTVCKDNAGSGCYATVQEAVNAAPNNGAGKFVIHIKEGVYEETVRVPLEKKNVVFIGDGMGKTVITGSLNVGQGGGISTSNTATVAVLGDGFMATALTIQNTAGPDAHQAVAFRSSSDLSIIENCEFLGNQDTLYAQSLRQYYKSCRIEGNVDFIFGNSASFFDNCQILVRPRQLKPEKGESNAVTAHGRTDPAESTGFVFQNCLINGTEEYMALYKAKPKVHKNFLGRPWKEYSRTVFIHCNLEALVSPLGWMPWSGDFALKTLYYGEFENSGAGSVLSGRVGWSSQVPEQHVGVYSVQSFIQGDEWIVPPSKESSRSGESSGIMTYLSGILNRN